MIADTGLVVLNRALLRAGFRRRVDGWRRAAGLVLRTEASTFVLSAFGLDAWSDVPGRSPGSPDQTRSHVAERLGRFLDAEAGCHISIKRGEFEDRTQPAAGPSYTLAFQPWVEGPARFLSPDRWTDNPPAPPPATGDAGVLLNIVCRADASGRVDVWMRVNHVGTDGVPVQEMLSRLESAWGVDPGLVYPTPEAFAPLSTPRPVVGCPQLCEVQAFIDFGPLVKWRKRENARLREPMTLSAAMLWCLARDDAFARRHMGTTVEVAARDGLGRGVGVVVVRPADYFHRKDGLARYTADFNRQLERTRRRASGSCRTLDAAALLRADRAASLLCHALENSPRAFGTLALTMLKDARVFGAPIARTGHPHGFIAVGSVALPAPGGSSVGCVTVKGPPAVVACYPSLIQHAVEAAG